MFSRNSDEFLRRFVTVDETWIHHNTPETKEQSKQWVSRGERGPKKAKQSLSANKVMATVFWDARGVIHIDYLEKGKTITGEYYSKLLDRFDVDLKQKRRPHLAKKKVLFHQDNARVHTCLVTMAKIHELRYELLPHPAYSPDLAPCDYYLFPNLKKWLAGKRFESNEEVITETNAYFESLEKTYYLEMLVYIKFVSWSTTIAYVDVKEISPVTKLMRRWNKPHELTLSRLEDMARKKRKERAEAIKVDFQNDLPDTVTVHWDGKLFPALDVRKCKEQRLPIGISYGDKEQLIAVPKLDNSTGS
ncbi:Histone-lysine N-methyltransferase SETMAR [Eumeta japonica]|uniref:Histone-lysine N-methyltransferase SETMAR n=1 Tax=Eumeta variegata TaxID=151549 RepID=A0A4C1YKS9_EUMVA|nr:Histone-lysine N-methyltransferase SETMAR [Eumeta japonica]